MKYSVVIPCYKSSKTIEQVVDLLQEEFLSSEMEIILVNDASPDEGKTEKAIFLLAEKYANVRAFSLAKNVGQHNAIMCGLNYASGDYSICIDDDMQTHPKDIKKLLNKLFEGYDVVYASYPKRKEKMWRRIGSRFSAWTVCKLIGRPKDVTTSSFWVAKKFIYQSMIEYTNANVFLPGLVFRITSNVANQEVEHYARSEGKSGYTFRKLVSLWSNLLGYSILPLRISFFLGGLFSVIGLACILISLFRQFADNNIVFANLLVGVFLVLAGICFIVLGIMGEYIGRIMMSCNKQPQYVVKEDKIDE